MSHDLLVQMAYRFQIHIIIIITIIIITIIIIFKYPR